MKSEYRAIPFDNLIDVPTRAQSKGHRAELVAELLSEKLNKLSEEGWRLVTSWTSASGTIFVFETEID